MTEVFFGPWSVSVQRKDADFDQRVVISGAAVGSGAHPGVVGPTVGVDGDRWELDLEWSDGGPWQPSAVRRTATFTPLDGLVVTLGGDDGPPATADHDFDDLVVVVQSADPALDPLRSGGFPYDFSLPEDRIVEEDHPPDD
jgi:hypothetical protein